MYPGIDAINLAMFGGQQAHANHGFLLCSPLSSYGFT